MDVTLVGLSCRVVLAGTISTETVWINPAHIVAITPGGSGPTASRCTIETVAGRYFPTSSAQEVAETIALAVEA